jgi:glycosyltransferase involved in cell wall biosynthesis
VAAALAMAGLLDLFIHGAEIPREALTSIPPEARRRVYWFQVIRRLVSHLLPSRFGKRVYACMLSLFDAQVARRIEHSDYDCVISYERSALETFSVAKARGMFCVLDAANIHPHSQLEWDPVSNTQYDVRRKVQEVELADLVLTCSSLARDSYLAEGVPACKLRAIPLGVDVALFARVGCELRKGPIRFCGAGILDRRKGLDLVARATRQLSSTSLAYEYYLAGNTRVADQGLLRELSGLVHFAGRYPHERLPEFFRSCDVFVLPSRFDSFGMVVSEALACGLPVIVSENVGAKDMVVEGVNGWVVPAGDWRALAERMMWCAKNPEAVRAMAPAARASAEARSWDHYRRDLAATIEEFLEGRVLEKAEGAPGK